MHKSKRTVTLAIYQTMINVVLFHCNTRTAREGLALLVDQRQRRRGGGGEKEAARLRLCQLACLLKLDVLLCSL